MKKFIGFLFTLFLSSALSLSAQELYLGLAGPITGNEALMGKMMKCAAELALDEVNKGGGINGKKVGIKYGDDQATPNEAATVSQNFAANPKILGIIGHFNSSCSLTGATIYNKNKVVHISPASTSPKFTTAGDYSFRTCFEDTFQGKYLAAYTIKTLGKKNIAILYDNDDYGQGLKENFQKKAEALGATVSLVEAYTRPTTDFKPQLIKIKEKAPEIIFISGLYNEGALICKQMRDLGIETPVIGGDGLLGQDLITLGGKHVEGMYLTFIFDPNNPDPKVSAFVKAFKEHNNGLEPDAWAALTYDTVQILLAALKATPEPTRESVFQYVQTVGKDGKNGYEGITGTTAFDANGDCQKSILMGTVKNGKIVIAEKQLAVNDMN